MRRSRRVATSSRARPSAADGPAMLRQSRHCFGARTITAARSLNPLAVTVSVYRPGCNGARSFNVRGGRCPCAGRASTAPALRRSARARRIWPRRRSRSGRGRARRTRIRIFFSGVRGPRLPGDVTGAEADAVDAGRQRLAIDLAEPLDPALLLLPALGATLDAVDVEQRLGGLVDRVARDDPLASVRRRRARSRAGASETSRMCGGVTSTRIGFGSTIVRCSPTRWTRGL